MTAAAEGAKAAHRGNEHAKAARSFGERGEARLITAEETRLLETARTATERAAADLRIARDQARQAAEDYRLAAAAADRAAHDFTFKADR